MSPLRYSVAMPSQYVRLRQISLAGLFVLSLLPRGASPESQSAVMPDVPTVLRINAREVILDVVARDKNNNPVTDLSENEFQVFEAVKHGDSIPRRVLSMRVIDPRKDASHAGAVASGFRISTGAVCALNATTHYELAIPASNEPGFHQVVIKSTRSDVKLSFRRRYYVGQVSDESRARERKASSDAIAVSDAACWHSLTPPTLALSARPVVMPDGKSTRYGVIVRPDSLPDIGLNGSNSRVQLDFGMCKFDSTGALAEYFHSSIDRNLTADDLKRAQSLGLLNVLEIPGTEPPHLARLVVRDRNSGNLGIIDVARPVSLVDPNGPDKALPRPNGSMRSFGVVTPHENTLCGDVYELSSGASTLPDFWNIDPVGSIYTDMLSVWDQDIYLAEGIPGATHTNLWFGIDYFGEFYVSKPGEYAFELQSDDGARLEIDNQQLVDLDGMHPVAVKTVHVSLAPGRHIIHVPYFQGSPTRLALVLRVKPPGESMRMFNLTEFPMPRTSP